MSAHSYWADLAEEIADRVVQKLSPEPDKKLKASTESLSTLQLAMKLHVHPDTVRRWAKEGCPHREIGGGRRRWDLAVVDKWLDARGGAT